ncbi:MAG: CCA tRNA nucleotidyltransferase [Lachnospiraceae bacterium]|nr:CCA tRNA nucleotidyltransferase [Lachnospiraceae bacterium]
MRIDMPKAVSGILKTLQRAGYEAYIVGGCVRDALLRREPSDWDITTDATPGQVQALFPKTIPTGIQHGTVTVRRQGVSYEVTTYRVDGVYEDARHPKDVTFTADLSEDLRRRDFTINALAYNEKQGLIDLFEGEKDLKEGIVRCVGDARERFTEDALRILRAYRFAAQLSFRVEDETHAAACEMSGRLVMISAERIRGELMKMICSAHPERIIDLYEAGATAHFFPEWDLCMNTPQTNPYHCYDVGKHIAESMRAIRPDPVLRLTMLLHDIAKPQTRSVDADGTDHFYNHPEKSADMAREIMKRLKYDNATIRRVTNLVRHHDMHLGRTPTKRMIRRMMHEVGREDFPLLLEVIEADNAAKAPSCRAEKEEELARIRLLHAEIEEAKDAVETRDLAITGNDLIASGIAPGAVIGRILETLLEEVIEDPSRNKKEYLSEEGKRLYEVYV